MNNLTDYKANLETGKIEYSNNIIAVEDLKWNEHPVFKGVFMKHIITGEKTNGLFSSHIVKINPGCEIGLHTHEGKTEIHEIVEGTGSGFIDEKEIEYKAGIISFIPADINHHVIAGIEGLFIFAKFFPALL